MNLTFVRESLSRQKLKSLISESSIQSRNTILTLRKFPRECFFDLNMIFLFACLFVFSFQFFFILDRTNYITLLKELAIPQPDLFYTFERQNYLRDFGRFGLDLLTNGRVCGDFHTDIFNFFSHVTRFKADAKHCPNQRLYRDDISQLADLITANDAFSILFYVKRIHDDATLNGTILMFFDENNPGNKFHLQETPAGSFVVR